MPEFHVERLGHGPIMVGHGAYKYTVYAREENR